jgi:ABC-2 type transport system ATP-binding protein
MTTNATAGDPMISTTDLRRVFQSKVGTVEAVAGVDLQVRRGEIFGFLGPNGAGKTTTMRMLVTLLAPTGGEATVAGFDLRRDPVEVRKAIGYVAQTGGTDPTVTGRNELVHQGRVFGMSRVEARDRAAELLDRFALGEPADRPTGTWSGGQRRRLDIAIGLVHRPSLVFLDEPTTGLDPQSRANMWDEVRQLRDDGTTVFLTTHYLDEADVLCDRLAIIDHGRIVAEGSPDELKRRIAGDVVTIGVDGDAERARGLIADQPFVRDSSTDGDVLRLYVDRGETATPAILRLLDDAGVPPTSLTLTRPSLDDVFLQQTGRSLREVAA